MVLSAVGRRREEKKKKSVCLSCRCLLHRGDRRPGVPFSLQWLESMGSPRRRDRHTNGLDVHIRKQNTQTWRAYRRASSRLFKNPWATPDAVICLFISPLHPIALSLHTLCSCLALFLSSLCVSLPYPTGPPGVLLSIPLSALRQSLH